MFQVNDKVMFGRPTGEQTLGVVEKVNRKSLKIRTLEDRGRGRAGQVWTVGPSLCRLVERPDTAAKWHPRGPSDEPSQFHVAPEPARRRDAPPDSGRVARALQKLTPEERELLAAHFRVGYISTRNF